MGKHDCHLARSAFEAASTLVAGRRTAAAPRRPAVAPRHTCVARVAARWQTCNEVRDAMLKLGKFWKVLGCVQGQKRPPAEVAKEVEENTFKKAKEMLIGSVARRNLSAL